MGGAAADAVEVVQGKRHPSLAGDGQEVEDSVGGAADGDDYGDGVRECLLGEDVAGGALRLQEAQSRLAGATAEVIATWVGGGDGGAVGQGHAQRLAGAGHSVGGVHAAAGALAGAGRALQLVQLLFGHAAGLDGADALEDVLDGDVLVAEPAGHDRAPVKEYGGNVQAGHGHEHAREALVTAGDASEGVVAMGHHHQLRGVGDDLAADQGGLHPLVAHGDAVGDGDGGELAGGAAGALHALLDAVGQAVQVDVAGGGLVPGAAHRDEGLLDVLIG